MDDPRRGRAGPRRPEEDTSGGFKHGGWHLRYFDDTSRGWVVESYAAAGGFLFGRRTFESLAGYWPNASEEEQTIAQPLNTRPKYVVSTTLTEPLEWQNSTVLKGDVADTVRRRRQAHLAHRRHSQTAPARRQPGDHHRRDPRHLPVDRSLTSPLALPFDFLSDAP